MLKGMLTCTAFLVKSEPLSRKEIPIQLATGGCFGSSRAAAGVVAAHLKRLKCQVHAA